MTRFRTSPSTPAPSRALLPRATATGLVAMGLVATSIYGASPVARAATAGLVTSFETGQPQPAASTNAVDASGAPRQANISGSADAASPLQVQVGAGPAKGYNIRPNVGFTGTAALRYSGVHTAAGHGYGWDKLFDVRVPVTATTQLSYKVFPEQAKGDTTYASTFLALDLHFTDGTSLSGLRATDENGVDASPSGQGRGKILTTNMWNSVVVDVGRFAAGRTIDRIDLAYDNPDAPAGTAFSGWVDDVQLLPTSARIDGTDRTNYVDVRRGTNSSGSFSRGNNLPLLAVPNGFTFLTPATDANSQSWEYSWEEQNNAQNRPMLQGLAISHEPSPWMGDRNQMSVMPSLATGVPSGRASDRALAFDHDQEVAHPDLYKVTLDGGITAEATPSDHGGVMRFTFPAGTTSGKLILDTVDDNGAFTIDTAGHGFSGWVDNGSGNSAGRSRMFVSGTFSAPVTGSGKAPNGHAGTQYVTLDTTSSRVVELHLATSFISLAQAQHNQQLELAGRSFDQVRAAANAAWRERLGRVDVTADNDTQLRTLYSNLYRMNLYPNSQSENTGTAAAPHWRFASPVNDKSGQATATTTNAVVRDGQIYVNNGFWDTYRTVWPAYTLLYPDVAARIADGFVQQYRSGGWIARWSSPGYADLMTGTSSDVALADAYVKGVALPDPMNTYAAALKNATTLSDRSAVGRKGLATSTFLGYTPRTTGESVSWALEGYINDFGIANMARALADKQPGLKPAQRARLREEAEYFTLRSTNYVNMFNPATGFFQGRNLDGSFSTQFDPLDWGGDYTETDAWNFAFHAPHDGNGLANLYGGRAGLEKKLDTFFATPEDASHPGGYGGTIHEMLEAAAVRMGQLGQSNQPSHHITYMYDYTGAQYKTAEKVREILRRLYVGGDIGQGYLGDEDNGEASSWYLLSSLGLYPLEVGSPTWVVGSPKFTHMTVHRSQGDLVVNAPANSERNVYVQRLSVDGHPQRSVAVSQSQLSGRARLDFTMGPGPSSFGSRVQDLPPSVTTGSSAPVPLQDATGPMMGTSAVSTTSTAVPVQQAAEGTDTTALFDNDSTTSVAFSDANPVISYHLTGLAQEVSWYSLTSGPQAGDPMAWTLQGSNDGKRWTTLDKRTGQTFSWRNQTRAFKVARPGVYSHYRIVVNATAGATAPNLAEVELLTFGTHTRSQALTVTGSTTAGDANAGQEVSMTLATVAGGSATSASSYRAVVDWGDGTTSDATVQPFRLGSYQVSGSHTYAVPGPYQVRVTVTDSSGARATSTSEVTVHPRFVPSYTKGFTSTCIADVGTVNNCDLDSAGISRQALTAAGVVPGRILTVPGTQLHWSLPSNGPQTKDNADGAGQVLPITLAPGATQLSLIGFGTQGNQDTVGTVTYTDGSTQDYPIQFTDWCGSAKFGNIVAVTMSNRLHGTGTDGCQAQFFATTPLTIPTGKTVASVTLPTQPGDARTSGRIHVVAVADNGSVLTASPAAPAAAQPGKASTVTLATVSGGSPSADGYLARVEWGDGSPTQDATVANGTVTATHTWAAAGTYTVRVLLADTQSDLLVTTTVTVGTGAQVTPAAVQAANRARIDAQVIGTTATQLSKPGQRVQVTAAGFAPGETVTLTSGSTRQTLRATPGGLVRTQVPVAGATISTVTLSGASSHRRASADLEVSPTTPRVVYHPQAIIARDGRTTVRIEASGFAPGEPVAVTSGTTRLGIVKANAEGVVQVDGLAAGVDVHQVTLQGRTSDAVVTAAV